VGTPRPEKACDVAPAPHAMHSSLPSGHP
jgi:hypothetical protein